MNSVNNLMSRKKLEWIAYNYELSSHARERIKERMDTTKTIKELIFNSPLAWKSANNMYCIAINLFEYLVVALEQTDTETPIPRIVTFIDTTATGVNVVDKFIFSYVKLRNETNGAMRDE